MAVQNIPRPQDDQARESLAAAAAAVLAGRRRDIPREFVLELYARAAQRLVEAEANWEIF